MISKVRRNNAVRAMSFGLGLLASSVCSAQDQKAFDAQAFAYLQDAKKCIDEFLADYAKTPTVSAAEIARASVILCGVPFELAATLMKKPGENQADLVARLKTNQEDATLLQVILIRARDKKK